MLRSCGASASWFPMLQHDGFDTAQPCSRHCGTRSPKVQREDTQGWRWGDLPLESAPSPIFHWSTHAPSPPSSALAEAFKPHTPSQAARQTKASGRSKGLSQPHTFPEHISCHDVGKTGFWEGPFCCLYPINNSAEISDSTEPPAPVRAQAPAPRGRVNQKVAFAFRQS